MARKKRRTFEPSFKKNIVEQIERGEISVSHAARLHELSPTVIDYWRKQHRAGGIPHSNNEAAIKSANRETEHYKRLLAEALREIDILKKLRESTRAQKNQNTSVIIGMNLPASKKGVGK
jgi:transposase-like protein